MRSQTGRPRPRRGIALFTTMFFVVGIGALALSAIYLTANASLLSKTYEKEDDLKYASEAALAIGKAELNFNPASLPNPSSDTLFVQLMSGKTLQAADGTPLNGIKVNLYAGQSGSTSGQFGRFASVVAEARDANGTGFVRRLELTQESFAKFAYWTNSEGSNIYFGGGDQLWGPVWSNDDIKILSSGVTFHDDVGTAGAIQGVSYGTYSKGYQIHQKPIQLPALTTLSSLSGLAATGGMSFTAPTTGDESTVRMRIEFVAADMDTPADNDSTGANEGFFRVYTANSGQVGWLRADWPGTSSSLPAKTAVLNCGDWHADASGKLKFFPIAVHYHPSDGHGGTLNTWFDTVTAPDHGGSISAAHTEGESTIQTIMNHPGARCFLGGDPHLAAVARTTALGYSVDHIHIGGEDTTFTPVDQYGSWTLVTNSPDPTIAAHRPADAKYLFPLYRGFNTSTKGVMYVAGTVGVSGVLRGDITLYTPNTIVVLDDLRYANDPAQGRCVDILGMIAGANTIVADNSMNSPQYVRTSSPKQVRSLDDTPDLYIQSVIMSLNTSFAVENYSGGPTNAIGCQSSSDGRGCLYLTGGLIQQTRGAVGTSTGTGYVKRYSYDRCAVVNPPPYFPTTGRFQDNRYYELDPVRFNVTQLYKSLSPH
ncbi:MAG TPA: hypothetical protein VHB25_03730 [Gemmatimonadaceae bacterium]|nr:hypothetical protein [Gemmatimonadaceae bacterium]